MVTMGTAPIEVLHQYYYYCNYYYYCYYFYYYYSIAVVIIVIIIIMMMMIIIIIVLIIIISLVRTGDMYGLHRTVIKLNHYAEIHMTIRLNQCD